MKFLSALTIISAIASTSPAIGHEFWLDPIDYEVQPDENIAVDLRVGSNFEGMVFSYIPNIFVRFDVVQGGQIVPVEGRAGDQPAMDMALPNPGLWVVVHETTDRRLIYQDWDKFVAFVEHKKLGDTLVSHAARGLPQTGFKEIYRRFVKSLIAVGDGVGADRNMGLRTEIIALSNPYTDNIANGLPVVVNFENRPRPNTQIEVFARAPDGTVTITTQKTDENGQAIIALKPGHEYNLDAVVMLPLEADDPLLDPVWKSLWAGLSFRVPD